MSRRGLHRHRHVGPFRGQELEVGLRDDLHNLRFPRGQKALSYERLGVLLRVPKSTIEKALKGGRLDEGTVHAIKQGLLALRRTA